MPNPAGPQNAELDAKTFDMLISFLYKLPERGQKVLKMRFGIGTSKHTLSEIGKDLGVSKERIRQLIERDMRKIRRYNTLSKRL